MMFRYYLTSRAHGDVQRIWDYIAVESLQSADRMVDRLTATFNQLAEYPLSGEELIHRTLTFRRTTVPPYVIYYQFSGGEVSIVRILHASRRWEDLL